MFAIDIDGFVGEALQSSLQTAVLLSWKETTALIEHIAKDGYNATETALFLSH